MGEDWAAKIPLKVQISYGWLGTIEFKQQINFEEEIRMA